MISKNWVSFCFGGALVLTLAMTGQGCGSSSVIKPDSGTATGAGGTTTTGAGGTTTTGAGGTTTTGAGGTTGQGGQVGTGQGGNVGRDAGGNNRDAGGNNRDAVVREAAGNNRDARGNRDVVVREAAGNNRDAVVRDVGRTIDALLPACGAGVATGSACVPGTDAVCLPPGGTFCTCRRNTSMWQCN